jgi:hypothetical protein
MVFIEQKPLLNHELVRHAIMVLGKNVLFRGVYPNVPKVAVSCG